MAPTYLKIADDAVSMDSLWELTQELRVGDYVAWQGSDGKDVQETTPRRVSKVEERDDGLKVVAEGPGGGVYSYVVNQAGESNAYYHRSLKNSLDDCGGVFFAELTDNDDSVQIREGFFDSRGHSR